MPKILPTQLVEAIDSLFGAKRNELDGRAVTHVYRAEVHALLTLLDEVPRELIDLRSDEYLELTRCRAVRVEAVGLQQRGLLRDHGAAANGGRHILIRSCTIRLSVV